MSPRTSRLVAFGLALALTAGPAGATSVDVSLPAVQTQPGHTVAVPLTLNQDVSGLNITSVQYSLVYGATYVTAATATATNLIGVWGQPFTNTLSDRILVSATGPFPLGTGTTLHTVNVTVSPSAPLGTDIPISLTGVLFNEGNPANTTTPGVIQVRASSAVGPAGTIGFALEPPRPNPSRGPLRLTFRLPEGAPARARLVIHAIDGRRVRTLLDEPLGGGPHEAAWDGRDEHGTLAAPGLYFARLEWRGARLEHRLVRVR